MRYNFRDKLGRFASRGTVRNRASSDRRVFQTTSVPAIVNGRLYDYKGSVVRAGRLCSNGKRHVSFHKQLHGFVSDSDLGFIPRSRVYEYLSFAENQGQ